MSTSPILRRLPPLALALAAGLLSVALSSPAPAQATRGIDLGLFDDVYTIPGLQDTWLRRTARAGAGSVRIAARWRFIAPSAPADPRDPQDPAYRFDALDEAVRQASSNGLEVVLDLTTAPNWAEGPGAPPGLKQLGAWDPDPIAYGDFARAVSERYSGRVAGLPRVRYYEAWNEPNYGATHLAPQWRNRKPYGVRLYRKLLNAMYDSVHATRPGNRVVAPSLGPFGRSPNGRRGPKNELASIRPLYFLRELFCLRHNRRMTPKACPPAKRPRFDILSHHPINVAGSPWDSAAHPDSVIGGDLGDLRRTLRKGERAGNIFPRKLRRPVWVTEFWWTTDPPDHAYGLSPTKQARNVEEALFVFWRARIERAFGFMIRDTTAHPTGLFTSTGERKPSWTAFRFPFVVERRTAKAALAWGRSPARGKLLIERRQGRRWREVARLKVLPGAVFKRKLKLRGAAKLRARVAGRRSLAWPLKAKPRTAQRRNRP